MESTVPAHINVDKLSVALFNKLCGRPPQSAPLQVDLLTLKVVSESRVTWATSVPILFFLGLSAVDFRPDVRDRRRQTLDAHHCLMPPPYRGGGIIMGWE